MTMLSVMPWVVPNDGCSFTTATFPTDNDWRDRPTNLVPESVRAGYSASEKAIAQMTTTSYAEQMILHSIKEREIYFCDGKLDEFIEAAKSLGFDYYYRKTKDGFDFMTWNPNDGEEVAKIKLWGKR